MCDKNAPQLTPSEGNLFRQVYPTWLEEDGEPSSQAFYPWRDLDDGCLSVDRSSLTTAENAYKLFTAPLPDGFGQQSAGAWIILMEDIELLGLTAWADPRPADVRGPENAAHALIEFGQLTRGSWKKQGRRLKVKARQLGRAYPPCTSFCPAPQSAAAGLKELPP